MEFQSLGSKSNEYKGLETFPKPKLCTSITLSTDEVTALCPITNQPDWYKVDVLYYPSNKCIESKSFKLFMHSLRDKGIFCEALSEYILLEIKKATSAKYIEVTITQRPRGGVSIIARSECNQE